MKLKYHNHEVSRGPLLTGYADSYVKLAKNRMLFVSEDVDDPMAAELSAMLLYLDNEDHEAPIEMYIHSNGGAVTGLCNIYDVMQMISAPVQTVCIGKCYSAAAVLLSAGTKGMRYAFKNASVMIHGVQFAFPLPGQDLTSSKSYLDFVNENNDSIMKILAQHTGHTLQKLKEDCKGDLWLTAQEALKYGIIDHIIG